MADPFDRDIRAAIDFLLEGEDDQHAIGDALHGLHPPRPPRPQLRTDVVHDRDAQPPHRLREMEVEVGRVDGDEDVGLLRFGVRDQAPIDGIRARKNARNFQESGNR